MRNVLVIGDKAARPFLETLEGEGFEVVLHVPGSEEELAGEPDAVVIDLESGAEDPVAKRMLDGVPTGASPPVIGILGEGQLERFDPARELDDFLLSSAPPAEVCARVRQAVWKRHRVDARNTLKAGDLVMDLENYVVHVSGRRVELTYKEYELLRFLATNQGRVFSRETLLNKVWGYDFYGGARTVDVHIRRLRAKIEDKHNVFIETVRNVGYRFRVGAASLPSEAE